MCWNYYKFRNDAFHWNGKYKKILYIILEQLNKYKKLKKFLFKKKMKINF